MNSNVSIIGIPILTLAFMLSTAQSAELKYNLSQLQEKHAAVTADLAACEEELQQFYDTGEPPYKCKLPSTPPCKT